jgi:hypothetical protein
MRVINDPSHGGHDGHDAIRELGAELDARHELILSVAEVEVLDLGVGGQRGGPEGSEDWLRGLQPIANVLVDLRLFDPFDFFNHDDAVLAHMVIIGEKEGVNVDFGGLG